MQAYETKPELEDVDSYFPSHPQPCALPHPNPTRSFWLYSTPDANILADHGKDAPLPDTSASGNGPVDILIVGTGISGISTLYHLIQRLKDSNRSVKRIVLLEAREFCSGATGRNGGHCTCYCPAGFSSMVKHQGLDNARRHTELEARTVKAILKLIEQNGWEDEVDLATYGNVHLIETQEEKQALRKSLDEAKNAGIDVSGFRFLSEEDCNKHIKSNGHLSGLQLPGNNLYPLKFVTKLYQLAVSQAQEIGIDIDLFTHTPVESITPSPSSSSSSSSTITKPQIWHVDTVSKGSIAARQVVFATNAYTSHVLPQYATSKQKIVPCRAQVIAIKPEQKEQIWDLGFSYNQGFEYFFQRPAKRRSGLPGIPYIILGGGRSIAPPPYELDVSDDSVTVDLIEKYLEKFLPTHFSKLFPNREKLKVDYHWTGIMGFTESRNPIVGSVYKDGKVQKGQYLLAGFSGHGMSRAGSCAEALVIKLLADMEGKECPEISWMPTDFWTVP